MTNVTNQTLGEYSSNGDGTYNGVKVMQWLVEALSGKPLSEEDAKRLMRDAQERARARLANKEESGERPGNSGGR